jgi:hypothetical protein
MSTPISKKSALIFCRSEERAKLGGRQLITRVFIETFHHPRKIIAPCFGKSWLFRLTLKTEAGMLHQG